jgi:DNA primase
MKLSKAAKIWIDYHKTHSKKNTVRAYQVSSTAYHASTLPRQTAEE